MKRPYRIISIAVLICFIFNSFSFAVDVNALATPSRCDDLMGIEHKDIGSIEFALTMHFQPGTAALPSPQDWGWHVPNV